MYQVEGGFKAPASGKVGLARTLLSQSLKRLADDDILKTNINRIPGLPKMLISKLAAVVSAYGMCLLESKGVVEEKERKRCWKLFYSRIANRFYEPLSRTNIAKSDMKRMYFQKVFYDVVHCYDDEEGMFVTMKLAGHMHESGLFSKTDKKTLRKNLGRLKGLFKVYLRAIRVYPRILSKLKSVISSGAIFENVTERVTHLEFRDFMCFKENYLKYIDQILHHMHFQQLETLSFINCKFDGKVLECFNGMIEKIHGNTEETRRNIYLKEQKKTVTVVQNRIGISKRNQMDVDASVADDMIVPKKKPRLADSIKVTFNDAAHCNDFSGRNSVQEDLAFEENLCSSQRVTTSNIIKLSFQNCSLTREATTNICEMLKKMPNLKSFTLSPEWQLMPENVDRIIHSLFCSSKISSDESNNKERRSVHCIENIMFENCDLGYFSKKLLLWHRKEECSMQYGISVPKPEVLRLIDCNLNTFRAGCSCKKIVNFDEWIQSGKSLGSTETFLHTEKCDNEFKLGVDLSQNCFCTWSNITSVDLSENKIGSEETQALAKALRNAPLIKSIKLAECNMDNYGCMLIFNLVKEKTSVEYLDMSGNSYDSRKDDSLSSLIENGMLRSLILKSCLVPGGLSQKTVKSFSNNFMLEKIDLSANRIGKGEFCALNEVLADASALAALKVLDLSGNQIPPEALPGFANALESSNRRLKEVKLLGNPIYFCLLQENNLLDDKFFHIIQRRVVSFKGEEFEHFVTMTDFESVM